MDKATRKDNLRNSRLYHHMQDITTWLDRYYLDAIAGLVPGGIGDAVSSLFSLVHVYFSLFKLRSLSLTLAILNNSLRDILLGMIPFYIGDAIDFFHKANKKNMALIDGFINDDAAIIKTVNQKAMQSLVVFILLIVLIFAMLSLITWLIGKLGTILFT